MDTRALEKRTSRRTKMVLGLKISQFTEKALPLLAHTLDISSSGAKIGALRECIQPGSVLVIQRKHNRAHCRVTWSRRMAPREIQIGIEFLSHGARFWELDLDESCGGIWLAASQR
jgi:hypothetical protein